MNDDTTPRHAPGLSADYLRRLRTHKRIIAAARLTGTIAGWVFAYGVLALIVLAIAELGLFLLTGHVYLALRELAGLLLLLGLPILTIELFRTRTPTKRS